MHHRVYMRAAALLCAVIYVCLSCSIACAEYVFSFMPTREHDGRTYEARGSADVTAVLLIGYDHFAKGDTSAVQQGYTNGGQSDFLLLVVLDHENKKIRRLHIDRDTMTSVKLIGAGGVGYGTRKLQICLAHAYGDTQEKNNANTVWAVEHLLGIDGDSDGAQIDWYMTMDISGIRKLNDLLGGITVEIRDDFSQVDPTMVQGTTMRLQGVQAEYFCRHRYNVGDQSNRSRMLRQQQYMSAAGRQLMEMVRSDAGSVKKLLNDMGIVYDTSKSLDAGFGFTTTDRAGTAMGEASGHYLMASRTLDEIVAALLKAKDYELMDVEELPGVHQIGSNGFMQYVLEEGAAEEWMMQVFYTPLN